MPLAARPTLRFYGWLFAVVGALFVLGEPLVLGLVSRVAEALAGAPALRPGGPSLWLGLTGSLMAVIAFLSLRLAADPDQPAAWEALLISKGISSALFLLFAAKTRNPTFAGAAAVDGTILAHLAWLRARLENGGDPIETRSPRGRSPFYEAWFARVNDPETGRAFWARKVAVSRDGKTEHSCWAIFFDSNGGVGSEKWAETAELSAGSFAAAGPEASWKLDWNAGSCPPAPLVPSWMRALGLTRSGYVDAAPSAVFDGEAARGGERWSFRDAPGSVGHVWGTGYGAGWTWAHAAFEPGTHDELVFELLSAPGPLGLSATSAVLWRDGKPLTSSGPWRLMRNHCHRDGDGIAFEASFGGTVVRGRADLGPSARLEYAGPSGERLTCRNSKLSTMSLEITDRGKTVRRETKTAALEFAER